MPCTPQEKESNMRINSIKNSLNFGRVYAIAGTNKNMQELLKELEPAGNKLIKIYATDLYQGRIEDGECTRAAKSGKEIYFVVAGKEDIENIRFMESGWGSVNGISNHITDFIMLRNNTKQIAKKIIKSSDE